MECRENEGIGEEIIKLPGSSKRRAVSWLFEVINDGEHRALSRLSRQESAYYI